MISWSMQMYVQTSHQQWIQDPSINSTGRNHKKYFEKPQSDDPQQPPKPPKNPKKSKKDKDKDKDAGDAEKPPKKKSKKEPKK